MEDRASLAKHWPLFGLSVRTPRLELRYPTDGDLAELADLSGDVHAPGFMPFQVPWTERPDGERERSVFQWHWKQRGDFAVDAWRVELVAVVDGAVVGSQGIVGNQFPVRRTVESGSWLSRARHGEGLGKEMRQAILHLAFDGLGAERAETGAFDDNGPSLGVTRRLGYAPNGELWHDRLGSPARELRFLMDREHFATLRRDDIEIIGLAPCLPLFGLEARSPVHAGDSPTGG